jgi:hypothetical protein
VVVATLPEDLRARAHWLASYRAGYLASSLRLVDDRLKRGLEGTSIDAHGAMLDARFQLGRALIHTGQSDEELRLYLLEKGHVRDAPPRCPMCGRPASERAPADCPHHLV